MRGGERKGEKKNQLQAATIEIFFFFPRTALLSNRNSTSEKHTTLEGALRVLLIHGVITQ